MVSRLRGRHSRGLRLDRGSRCWARERHRPDDLPSLTKDPELLALIQLDVDAVNRRLASYETIKRFFVLDHELSTESGELTDMQKVRRSAIRDRYADIVASLY